MMMLPMPNFSKTIRSVDDEHTIPMIAIVQAATTPPMNADVVVVTKRRSESGIRKGNGGEENAPDLQTVTMITMMGRDAMTKRKIDAARKRGRGESEAVVVMEFWPARTLRTA